MKIREPLLIILVGVVLVALNFINMRINMSNSDRIDRNYQAGLDRWTSFKNSEIGKIMSTTSPYVRDKQRLEDHFREIDRRLNRIEPPPAK